MRVESTPRYPCLLCHRPCDVEEDIPKRQLFIRCPRCATVEELPYGALLEAERNARLRSVHQDEDLVWDPDASGNGVWLARRESVAERKSKQKHEEPPVSAPVVRTRQLRLRVLDTD